MTCLERFENLHVKFNSDLISNRNVGLLAVVVNYVTLLNWFAKDGQMVRIIKTTTSSNFSF